MNITPNELKALQGIVDSDFQDGNDPVDRYVWSWSANPFTNKRTHGGVVASLVKKGLATTCGNSGDEACVAITQSGMDALKR